MIQDTRLYKWCSEKLIWCGQKCQELRDFLEPLADLRIMLILLVFGGVLLLFIDAGKDVVQGLVDGANDTGFLPTRENAPIFFRWFMFWLACVWTGINAWYWAHLLYKSKQTTDEPPWFTSLRRFLGIWPLLCAMIAMPLAARHGLYDTYVGMFFFAVGVIGLWMFFRHRISIAKTLTESKEKLLAKIKSKGLAGNKEDRLTESEEKRLAENNDMQTNGTTAGQGGSASIVRGDLAFIYCTLVVSFIALVLLCIPVTRTDFARTMGPAALTFGAIGCIIPVTSLLIWFLRQFHIPIVLIGIIAFVLFSVVNDNHQIRDLKGDAKDLPRPAVIDAYNTWAARHPNRDDPLILIASAGGASRAAYWTATVFRAFDDRTKGKFFDNVFAISSVSGGTLGSIGYAAWLSGRDASDDDNSKSQRLRFVQNFFGADYLGPSLAGLLYPDLLSRFFLVPVLPDRAVSLEEAFEMGWNASANCGKPPCGATPELFSHEYTRLWADKLKSSSTGRWVPIVLANGTHVETGKRIITAPVKIDSAIFEDAHDFYDLNQAPVRASTAVLNSARFTLVSPAGRMMRDGRSTGGIIDGGYFENGALETLYDLARFITSQDGTRKIIIIEILNDDTMSKQDQSRHPPSELAVEPPKATWSSGLLGEFTSIIGGLYDTRSSRGVLGAKRLSNARPSGLLNARFFSFDLQPYGKDCHGLTNWFKGWFANASELDSNCYTAMSWALSQGSLDAMDVSFNMKNVEDIKAFLKPRNYWDWREEQQEQDLGPVVAEANKSGGNNDRLDEVLTLIPSEPVVPAVQAAPAEASKRK